MSAYEHQEYPKWIDHPTEVAKGGDNKERPKRVLVQNEKEEAELTNGKKQKQPEGWKKD